MRKIIEHVEETVTGYDDFEAYKQSLKNVDKKQGASETKNDALSMTYVYHGTDKSALDSIKNTGGSGFKEFFGKKIGQVYGRGIYTMLNFNDVCVGDGAVVRCAVKAGAFDNFIIWENSIRDILFKRGALTLRHETLYDNIKRLIGDEGIKYIEKKGYAIKDLKIRGFLNIMREGEPLMNGIHKNLYSETRLDTTEIDGFCFLYGGLPAAVFRRADLLIPNKIFKIENGEETEEYAINDSEHFDRLNTFSDAFSRFRKDGYDGTLFDQKNIAGFTFVKSGDKGNYYNGRNDKFFSPTPLDNATAFSPDPTNRNNGEATFTLGNGELIIEFCIKSVNNAKDVKVYYRKLGNSEWIEFEGGQQGFFNYISKKINANKQQKLNEVFMNGSVEDFKKNVLPNTTTLYSRSNNLKQFGDDIRNGKKLFFYTCSNTENKKSMMSNGATPEFTGTSSDSTVFQGIVSYGAFSVAAAENNMKLGYGNTIYKFVLNDDVSNGYLIFDPNIRNIIKNDNKTLYDDIVDMCGKKTLKGKRIIDIIDYGLRHPIKSYGQNENIKYEGIDGLKHISNTNQGDICAAFFAACRGDKIGMINKATEYDERIIKMMGIKGYIYNGGRHWDCLCVRNFNALMPVGYATAKVDKNPKSLPKDESGHIIWTGNEFLDNRFDFLRDNVYAPYQYGKEYDKTSYKAKQINGYVTVQGSNGYNVMSTKMDKPILPVNADFISEISPFMVSNEPNACAANMLMLDKEWEIIIIDNKINFRTQVSKDGIVNNVTLNSQQMYGLIKKYYDNGKFKGKTFYNDSIIGN